MTISNTLQINDISVDLLAPVITALSPEDESVIYSLLPEFSVTATDLNECQCRFQLYTDIDEELYDFGWWSMTEQSGNVWVYSYKMLESDDYLIVGVFKIKVTVKDALGFESTQTNTFSIINDNVKLEPLSLIRDFDGSSLATLQFRIKNNTENRIDLRFFLQELIRVNHCKLVELQTFDGETGQLESNNIIKGIKSTDFYITYNIKFRYNTATELTTVTNELKKSVIEVGNKIEITKYNEDIPFDISNKVENVSFDRNVELGAKQLTINFGLDEITNPFYGANPYVMFGNKIVLKQIMKVNGVLEECKRFTGTTSDINVTKTAVSITAYDDFKLFQDAIDSDLTYSPTKIVVGKEMLRTFDGIKFASRHINWCNFPPPEIYLGTTKLEPGEYQIDYYRGIVYIYRNVFLAGDWKERDLDVDNVPDRKTFQLDYPIDSNSSLEVYHKWQEKVLYSCIDGVEAEYVWIDKKELFSELTDYSIDYENNKVILTTPIPTITDTIRNHYIYIISRAIEDISATYSYMKEGTNEAEDIIRDVAERTGFSTTKLYKTIIDEVLYSRDGINYYTGKNNIKVINYLKVNGSNYSKYELENKKGKIKINRPGLTPFDLLIDPLESINNILIEAGSGDTIELSSDSRYGNKSVKCSFSQAGYVEKNYDYTYFRKNLENYNRFAVYLKGVNLSPDFVATITLRDNDGHLQNFNFSLNESEWTKCICDVSSITWRDDICFIKIAVNEECILYTDYFHIPMDDVVIKYSYYTLQATETTINEVYYFREEVDKALDILEDILAQCDPSYLVYVDEEGYLCGEFTKIRWSLLENQVYKTTGLDYMVLAGKFLLEDYRLQLISDPQSSISDENIYTSVLVCGKLADRRNVALEAISIVDNCDWDDEVISYSKQGTTRTQTKEVPYLLHSFTLIHLRQGQESQTFAFDGTALIDNDVNSGVHWYMTTKDGTNKPDPNSLMITIELKEAIYWEEIAICVGAYKNKTIRQELYIKIVGEDGSEWFPEGEVANRQNGNTGSWLVWKNSYQKNKKITKIKIYSSEAWTWVTSTAVTNSKK